MPSLRKLCGGVDTNDHVEQDLTRHLRSRSSFKTSQQIKQQFAGLEVQPSIVPRAGDALVNLHGGRALTRAASESRALGRRTDFVRLSSMSHGMSRGLSTAIQQAVAASTLPTTEESPSFAADHPQQLQQLASASSSPSAAAHILLPSTPTHNTPKQQQATPQARDLKWTSSRRLLDFRLKTEQAASARNAQPDDLLDDERLQQRLDRLGLDMLEADADGNCQFRSLSQQLTGSQEHHETLRQKAVDHIRVHCEEYELFLGEDFDDYTEQMEQDGTWGDELTLRALSDALGVVVHVVTSSQHHWYLQYQPEAVDPAAPEVFLTYVAPIHYNSLRRQPLTLRSGLVASFKRSTSRATQPTPVAAVTG